MDLIRKSAPLRRVLAARALVLKGLDHPLPRRQLIMMEHVDGSIDHGSHVTRLQHNPTSVTAQHDDLDPELDTSEDPILLQPGDTLAGSSSSSKQRDSTQFAQPRPAVQADFSLLISQSSRPVGDRGLAPSKRQASQILDSQHQRKKPRSNLLVQGELSDDRIHAPGPSPKDNIPTIYFPSKREGMKGRKVRHSS
ncbi:hypothetical protein BS47DRAFT_1070907 [Hydnum rufescens UP504]|uniref:Uncharacterized protein n=1 Tax=Hydnum rufescens UP504 TaxID=1448309 RepID=A0A9P6DZK1_9AGAM|nr:hypothetical protein BS47DRAFT_1070907 [Hydnum rufescens UP504]